MAGRTPRLLDVMSHEDDSVPKENAAEMRVIALRSMVQASAEDKIKRAERSRTRPAGELAELNVGDWVDIYTKSVRRHIGEFRHLHNLLLCRKYTITTF